MRLDLSINKLSENFWAELDPFIKEEDKEGIKSVLEFAENAHKDQKRESGEPFFNHPLWVAKVVAQLSIGTEAIKAALLHDIAEDTEITINDVSELFGDEVALLLDGLTEVKKKTKDIEVHSTNIEVFRRFLFSSVNDVRILIIRLVDKVHNGLTVGSLSKERQIKFAKRAFGIYSPVAEYVGLHYFKRILDDIAFKILYEEEAEALAKDIENTLKDEVKALNIIRTDIEQLLSINNINNIETEGRIKSLYSTYMKKKMKGENSVKDRVGIRVLTDTVEQCYMILGLLHSRYQYLSDEFDDYISSPKPNGYRSIQTTLKWKKSLTVEVQIRTKEMHEFNEFGPASHVAYKARNEAYSNQYAWIKDLVNWQKGENNVNNYRINVLSKYIYVFTPKGDTIQLPKGSTALDFAYRIHSDIGDHCYGVKINNKMSKIDAGLNTGDYVEIITSKSVNPKRSWLEFVKTPWARERIRKVTEI